MNAGRGPVVPLHASAEPAGPGSDLSLVRLLHLVSPALPVGAYAYSQGLETAVALGWVADEAQTLEWLAGIAAQGVGTLDLPLLLRMHRAWTTADLAAAADANQRLVAARETGELRAEDRHLGAALLRILQGLGIEAAARWREEISFAGAFALAAVHWGIGERAALAGYLWSWTENQVLAAIKLVPLGQSAGQRLLHRLSEDQPRRVDEAMALADEDIGSSTAAQVLASALHETQYTRLFRS